MDLDTEEWRPVPGYHGYEASDQGRVRSWRKVWVRRASEPHILKATAGPCGYRTIQTSAKVPNGATQRVGVLIALAFIGPAPSPEAELRRLDGDPTNDLLCNLAWGTLAEVHADHRARARREEAAGAPTHCPEGHRYADNWLANWGQRDCHRCRLDAQRAKSRRPAESPCIDCATPVQQTAGAGPRFKRCPDCRKVAVREYYRRYRRQAVRRDRTSYCTDCGDSIANSPSGPKAKRCVDCKRVAQRAADKRWRERPRSA